MKHVSVNSRQYNVCIKQHNVYSRQSVHIKALRKASPPSFNTSAQDSTRCTDYSVYATGQQQDRDDILHNLQNVYRYKIGTTTRQRRDNVTKDKQRRTGKLDSYDADPIFTHPGPQ